MGKHKKINTYTYNNNMLDGVKDINDFFDKNERLRVSDYVIDGQSALDFYGYTRSVLDYYTLSLTNRKKVPVYDNLFKKENIDNKIKIIRTQTPELLSLFLNHFKEDKNGNPKQARIVSVEKLFCDLDNFKLLPDEKQRAIEKMKKDIDKFNFAKIIRVYRNKKLNVSKAALQYEKEIKEEIPSIRSNQQDELLVKVQNLISNVNAITIGGIAVEQNTDKNRSTFDLDFHLDSTQTEDLLKILEKELDVKIIKELKQPTKDQIEKHKHQVFSLEVSKKGKSKKDNVNLKLDIDMFFDDNQLNQLKLSGLAKEKEGVGWYLCPEMLLLYKMTSILNTTSPRKINGVVPYKARIIKDIVDINNLCHTNDIKIDKLLLAKETLQKFNWEEFDLSHLDNLLEIIKEDNFVEKYNDVIERNNIDYLFVNNIGENVVKISKVLKDKKPKKGKGISL